MKTVVVGGQSRNVGKTSLACGLIAAMPERRWTAVKITQFGHGVCASDGEPCDCAVDDPDHPYSLTIERDRNGSSDTARLLRAGARQVLWLRVMQGRLADAMGLLEQRISGSGHALFESNSVLEFLSPDLYLTVLDPSVEDFKASAKRFLPRADAVAEVGRPQNAGNRFGVAPPDYCSADLVAFVTRRLSSEG